MIQAFCRQSRIVFFWAVSVLLAGSSPVSAQIDSVPDSARVEIRSTPLGGFVFMDGKDMGVITPTEMKISAGEHLFEIILEDNEPLAKRLELEAGKLTRMDFALQSLPPPPVTAQSLELVRLPKIKKLNEKVAASIRRKWTGMAEAFAIVPLGQGILARLVLPSEHKSAANTMVLTGLGLTVGSYMVGKILGKRKLLQIRARNDEIPGLNEGIRQQNQEIDQTVKAANAEVVRLWLAENEGRGIVTVSVE